MTSADHPSPRKRPRFTVAEPSKPINHEPVDRYGGLFCQPTASQKAESSIEADAAIQCTSAAKARRPSLSAGDADDDLPEVGRRPTKPIELPSSKASSSYNPLVMGWLPKPSSSPPKPKRKRLPKASSGVLHTAKPATGEIFDISSSPEKPISKERPPDKPRTINGGKPPIADSGQAILDVDDDQPDPIKFADLVARTLLPKGEDEFVKVHTTAEGADHDYMLSSPPELQRPASQSRLIGEELQPNTRQKASSTHSVDLDSDSDDAIQTQPSKSANPKQNSKGLIGVQRSATRSQSHDLTGNHRKLNDNEASSRRSGSPTKASARRQGKVRDTTKPTPVAAPLRDIDQYTSASPRRRGLATSPTKIDAKTIQRDKRGHAVSAATKSHFVDAGESDSDTVVVAASVALSQPSPRADGATAPAKRRGAFHLSTQDSDTSASEASHAASSIRTRPRAKGIARGPSAAVANNAQEAGGHVPRRRSLSSERSGADTATSRSPSVASASTARRRARPFARGPTTGTRAKLSATDTASDSQDARASPGRHRRATSDDDETLPTSTQVIMRNLKRRPLPMVELADIQSQYVPDESVLEGLEEAADGPRCAFCDGALPSKPSQGFIRMYTKLCRKPEVRPRPFSRNPNAIQLPSIQTAAACKRHREEREIIPAGIEKGYPAEGQIDWKDLPRRLSRLQADLMKIVRGDMNSSLLQAARGVWQEKGARKMANVISEWTSFDDEIPGYYGPMGIDAITEWLNKHLVTEHIVTEQDAAPLDMRSYVRRVLVPEMAILLIIEDQGPDCGRNKAVRILKASRAYGAAVFPSTSSDINADATSSAADTLEEDRLRAEAIAANGQRAVALGRGETALAELSASKIPETAAINE